MEGWSLMTSSRSSLRQPVGHCRVHELINLFTYLYDLAAEETVDIETLVDDFVTFYAAGEA